MVRFLHQMLREKQLNKQIECINVFFSDLGLPIAGFVSTLADQSCWIVIVSIVSESASYFNTKDEMLDRCK